MQMQDNKERKNHIMDILNKQYIIPNPTKDKLLQLNFRYSKTLSNNDENIYILRLPICKYKKYTTLECVILTDLNTGMTSMGVFNSNINMIYPPCYNDNDNGYKSLLKIIEHKINKIISSIGIEEKNNGFDMQ